MVITSTNGKMDDMKIIKSLRVSGLLMKGFSETLKNEAKKNKTKKKGGFLSMLLDTLGPSLLENLLTGKGVKV